MNRINQRSELNKNVEEIHQKVRTFFALINQKSEFPQIQQSEVYQYFEKKRGAPSLVSFTPEEIQKCEIQQDEKRRYLFQYNGKKIPFEFETIKRENNSFLLLLVNMIRLYYVDHLLKEITSYFTLQQKEDEIRNYFNAVEVGSSQLTSNYNITVSGIMYPQKIVEYYNHYFYLFWNDYSPTVFDTNIYGSSFFITIPKNFQYTNQNRFESTNQKSKKKPLYSVVTVKDQKKILYLHPNDDEQRAIFFSQMKWLLLKIQYHLYDLEIQNNLHTSLLYQVREKIFLMVIGKNVNRNINSYLSSLFEEKDVKIPSTFAHNTQQKIQLYETSQKEIQPKQIAYEKKPSFETQSALIDSISRSNYYGFETYFCMGTIYHVVGHLQGAGSFHMTYYYYVESAFENFIDIYRYYPEMMKSNVNMEYVIIKMSKYIYRVYDALSHIYQRNSQSEFIQTINEKRDLFQKISIELKRETSFHSSTNTRNTFTRLFLNSNKISIIHVIEQIWTDISRIQIV